jgi:hypothetical protein
VKAKPMKSCNQDCTSLAGTMVGVAALLVAFASTAWAQRTDFSPDALASQRSSIYVKATHGALADVENELNHFAVLSETCRVEYGGKPCGLSDKVLGSDKLEERYAYYVKRPLEAHLGKQVKVSRRNWDAPGKPDSK